MLPEILILLLQPVRMTLVMVVMEKDLLQGDIQALVVREQQ